MAREVLCYDLRNCSESQANCFLFREVIAMLYWTLVFLVIALIAGALGFGIIGGMAYTAAKILFVIFLVLFVLSLFGGMTRRPIP
jgi:uncharacterized membrane protein YtjA (UPF0391 family)